MDIDDAIRTIGFGKFHVRFLLFLFCTAISQTLITLSPTYLQQILTCEWKITKTQSAGIVVALFIGMVIGSLIHGSLSDKYGRTKLFKWSMLFLMCFSGTLIFTPNWIWTMVLHLIIGFFLSGSVGMIIILMTEVFPLHNREVGVIVYSVFTCIGADLISLMSHFIVKDLGWRYFLSFQLIPVFFVVFSQLWLPESPRFLLLANKKEQCLKVLNQMSRLNGRVDIFDDVSIKDQGEKESSSVKEIINRQSVKYIACVSLICFNCGISYFGIALLSNIFADMPHKCFNNDSIFIINNNVTDDSCCSNTNTVDFQINVIASSSELPTLLVMWLLSRFVGRKLVLIVCNVVISTSMILLNFCCPLLPEICISISRGAALSLFPINDLYGNEVFPTSIRGLAFGICSVFTRLGSIIAPFVINTIFAKGMFFQGTMIYCAINVFVIFVVLIFLPETRHRKLRQTF